MTSIPKDSNQTYSRIIEQLEDWTMIFDYNKTHGNWQIGENPLFRV
jgi:hypothetical protein